MSAETHKCTSGYTSGLPQECQGTVTRPAPSTAPRGSHGRHARRRVRLALRDRHARMRAPKARPSNNTASFVNPPEYDLVPGQQLLDGVDLRQAPRLRQGVLRRERVLLVQQRRGALQGHHGRAASAPTVTSWPPRRPTRTATTPSPRLDAGDLHCQGHQGWRASPTSTRPRTRTPPRTTPPAPITLNADHPVQENVNFGYVKKHAISGAVYLDQNRDKTKNTRRHRPVRCHREAG